MALNSINTNVAAYYAQSNIGKASNMASSSIARLSSGNRIVKASDDVAAMSAGTSLRTQVTTLRMALINTSQGASLLQVADGALSQITEILQRQKAIAIQSGAGSLGDAERSFLNQEFSNLSAEIDRLTQNTNFNGVNLIDGSLSEKINGQVNSNVAAQAIGGYTFNINATNNQTIIINGTTFTATTAAAPTAVQFRIGATTEATLDNLVAFLNANTNTNISQATYSRVGQSLNITHRGGGQHGEAFTLSMAGTWTAVANAAVSFGQYGEAIRASNSTTVSSYTADATAAALTTKFAAGVLTVDGTTVYTVVAGDSLRAIVNGINANANTTGIRAWATGTSGAYQLNVASSNTAAVLAIAGAGSGNVTSGAAATNSTVRSLVAANETNEGLGIGRTVGRGNVGDQIILDQNQTASKVVVSFPEIADGDLTLAANFGTARTLTVAGQVFNFSTAVTAATAGPTEIAVQNSLIETLDNAVATLNNFFRNGLGSGLQNYQVNQITARRDGNNIVLEGNSVQLVQDIAGAAVATPILAGPTGSNVSGSFAATSFTNNGVNANGITNEAFIGKIDAPFEATYNSVVNTVNLAVTIGDKTYNALNVGTNPAANTTVRMISNDGGGYFDIVMRANGGQVVNSQASADQFAARLSTAIKGLNFYQERSVTNYDASSAIFTNGSVTGSLVGTKLSVSQSDFTSLEIDSIRVNAPVGASNNGTIEFTINGETYRSAANVGEKLGAYSVTRFTNVNDVDEFVEFTAGAVAIDFSDDDKAAAFQAALQNALGVGDGSASLQFQVGVTTEDTLQVGIGNAQTTNLYGGETLDVLTQATAARASDVIDEAIRIVTSLRAEVGALQSRFNFAAANVESSLQNQDAARGVLLDTDIASESTAYANAQVQLQAGIAVLAQANLLPQNLLKLIG